MRRRDCLLLAAAPWIVPAAAARHAQRHLFGSPVDLLLPPGTPARTEQAVWRGLQAMHTRWNAWKPGELTELNQALAAGRSARVTPALRRLIVAAARFEQRSGGHFNAGIGGLVGQWGFHADTLRHGSAPSPALLQGWVAARPGLAQLHLQGLTVRSDNPRLQLDFGGFGKGVALDWALDTLQQAGVDSALVNLGGNLAAMGSPGGAGGRPWQVGVRDPFGPGCVAVIATRGREAVVTSGTYERFRLLADGRRCGHVIDPVRGTPAGALASVTVVHADAALADAASTALLVAGPSAWAAVARRMGVQQALVIDEAGQLHATAAMKARLA